MNLSISLRSELLKPKRTAALRLCLIVGALIPAMLLLEYSTAEAAPAVAGSNPWSRYLTDGHRGLNLFLMPLFIILACTLLPRLEYRNNTWKQVPAAPQAPLHLMAAKYITVLLLLLLVLLCYNVLMVLTALFIDLLRADLRFGAHRPDWQLLAAYNGKTCLAMLAISALQFWLGLRFRNFITAIGIGCCLWLAGGMLVFEVGWAHADLFPFSYPLLFSLPRFQGVMPFLTGASLIYTFLFLAMAYIDTRTREVKVSGGH